MGLKYHGLCGDACKSPAPAVGKVSPEAERLLAVTRECLRAWVLRLRKSAIVSAILARRFNGYVPEPGFSVMRQSGVAMALGRILHGGR